jgi:hypothetical protein
MQTRTLGPYSHKHNAAAGVQDVRPVDTDAQKRDRQAKKNVKSLWKEKKVKSLWKQTAGARLGFLGSAGSVYVQGASSGLFILCQKPYPGESPGPRNSISKVPTAPARDLVIGLTAWRRTHGVGLQGTCMAFTDTA